MNKRKRIGEVKKSNHNHSIATVEKPIEKTEKKQKVVITSETTLRVTFYERGAFKEARIIKNGNYKSPLIPFYHEVAEAITMSNDAVQFFISEEGRTRNIDPVIWKKMGKEARIRANVEWTADGRKFDILYIN